jgi:hypothetical protein
MRYAVVIEKANGNYSAYVPDLPGCAAMGETVEAVGREFAPPSAPTSRGLEPMDSKFQRPQALPTTSRRRHP